MPGKCTVEVGKIYGKLTVIEDLGIPSGGIRKWFRCRCECGNVKDVSGGNLVCSTRSCGCLKKHGKGTVIHGECSRTEQTITYKRWRSMRSRVKRDDGYKHLSICQEWLDSYEAFKLDMGECPSSKHTLDRMKNELGYFKENCRWVLRVQQERNKTNNVIVVVDGKSMVAAEWIEMNNIYGGFKNIVYYRLRNGLSPQQAVEGLKRTDGLINIGDGVLV